MTKADLRTFTLLPEQAAYIDTLLASGSYASISEVVGAGLMALQERDGGIDRWLATEVAVTYDAMTQDPYRALSLDQTFAAISAHRAARANGQ